MCKKPKISPIGTQCSECTPYIINERLAYFKLPSETHEIITNDGYILTAFRIPNPGATPVLFVHGFLGSSDVWLLQPRKDQNIATILYDEGFDIWLLNIRGNEYSRKHIHLSTNTNNKKYWDFGFHEVGISDIPATVNYILQTTKQKSLLYVGHSMGTTVCMVACSEVPEINRKIKAAVLLAPVIFPLSSSKVPFVKLLVDSADFLSNLLYYIDVFEFLGQNPFKYSLINTFCNLNLAMCAKIYGYIYKQNLENMDINYLPFYIQKFTSGTSVKLFRQIANVVASNKNFTKFNHGPEKNLEVYGSHTPPRYPTEKVTVPLALFHSKADAFLDEKSLDKVRSTFKNIIFDYQVPDPLFTHLDYLYGLNSRKLVANQIIKIFHKYRNKNEKSDV